LSAPVDPRIADQQERLKLEQAKAREDLKVLLASTEGRRSLRRLLQTAGVSFFPSNPIVYTRSGELVDVQSTMVALGAQQVARNIQQQLYEIDPAGWLTLVADWAHDLAMERERFNARKRKEAENS